MFRVLTIGFVLLALSGCEQDRATAHQARQDAYHRKCLEYGFSPGSEAYGQCRQRFDEMAYTSDVARRAVITQHLLQRTIILQRSRQYQPNQ